MQMHETEEEKKKKEQRMWEEITLIQDKNKRLQAMKQSKMQFSDVERNCNADDPKKQFTPSKIMA